MFSCDSEDNYRNTPLTLMKPLAREKKKPNKKLCHTVNYTETHRVVISLTRNV